MHGFGRLPRQRRVVIDKLMSMASVVFVGLVVQCAPKIGALPGLR